ncbi:MAG: ATP-binding protein [Pseudomonadota bacterium]
MPTAARTTDSLDHVSEAQAGWPWVLIGLSVVLCGSSLLLQQPWPAVLPLAAGASIATVGLVQGMSAWRRRGNAAPPTDPVAGVIERDASPSLIADADGVVRGANAAARERFSEHVGDTLARTLRDLMANPSALLARLQTRAEARGAAREDVVTHRGHMRLSVHLASEGVFVWRLEDLADRSAAGRGVDGLSLPMLTVGKSGAVLFMNEALRRIVGGRAKTLDRIFDDLPLRPYGEHDINGVDGKVRARVVQVEGAAGRREVFLVPTADDTASAPGAPPPLGGTSPTPEAAASDLLESLPVALVKLTGDGEVRMANRLARELLGEEECIGKRLPALVEGVGRPIPEWLADAANGRGLHKAETARAKRRDRETFVQVTFERIAEGGETLLLAVLNDATELKTLEAQFVQSQKMQAIGQLAGGVAHDFNNLLTAISGHCDLLLLRHAPDDPDYADLVQINQNANRAASLVGQLLAFSRKQTLQLEAVDLSDSMGELAHLLNRLVGEKIHLTVHHDPELKPIRADKRQLEQVIMNLVVNARDAMPDGGEVRIETQTRRLSEAFRRDRAEVPAGDYVLVRVTDEGKGIPAENLPKIFEPFFSTKKVGEGTGLGLSTAYGIVKQTGGFIFADSVIGEGTTFTLFFPVYNPPPTAPGPTAEVERSGPIGQGEGVVLLVEDEAPVRAFASRALRMRGYTVIEAECAEDALLALEDEDLKVDVFVTDVIMPGMDGPSWVRKALEDRPDAKVVFVSGYAEESFSDAQQRIPNSVFLPKPFSLSDLAATVHDQIH